MRDDRRPIRPTTRGSPRPSRTRASRRWGCRRPRSTASRPSSGRAWPPAPRELGDVGESSPEHWEKPLGSPDVHVALAAISPDAARLQRRGREGAARPRGARRRRGDLAAGLLPAADRADVLRLQGRDRPAVGRGQRPAALQPAGAPSQGGRDHPRIPRRVGRASADADPGRARPQRHLHRLPQAPHAGGGLPAVPAREEREPRGRGAPGRQDGRPLAERRPARGLARARRPGARRRPAAPQRLPLRRRPARPQVPARRPRATREPARRVRRRRRRRRSPAPHDPARHQLRADAARGRARGRRRRPRHHLRLRRRAHRAPVRVREDPVAERRHLHRRAAGEGPAGRSERRHRDLHRARSGRSAGGCRTCRRSSSPAAASTASSRACARCAGWRSSSRDRSGPTGGEQRGHEPHQHRPVEGPRLRPAAVRPRGAGLAGARRLPLRRPGRADHPQPAPRRQRDHHRDGRAPDRDRRDDRGPAPPSGRSSSPAPGSGRSPSAATCASART